MNKKKPATPKDNQQYTKADFTTQLVSLVMLGLILEALDVLRGAL